VSGGGIEFMRPWTENVYGIPPEQVIGSSIKTKFELRTASPCSCACRRSPSLTTMWANLGINQYIGHEERLEDHLRIREEVKTVRKMRE
jgi:hypothetical protein